jgi:hypothetical protein
MMNRKYYQMQALFKNPSLKHMFRKEKKKKRSTSRIRRMKSTSGRRKKRSRFNRPIDISNIDGTAFVFSTSSDSDVRIRYRLRTALSRLEPRSKAQALDKINKMWNRLNELRKPMHRLNRMWSNVTPKRLVAAVKAYHEHIFQWMRICHQFTRFMKSNPMKVTPITIFKKKIIIGAEKLELPSLNGCTDRELIAFAIRIKKKKKFLTEGRLEEFVKKIVKTVWKYSPFLKSVSTRPRWLKYA